MLHELLLSLSGFPSPLFDPSSKTGDVASDFPLVSPPEAALLASLGQLALRHREVRDHVTKIVSSHPSTVCRAVAGSISSTQLARFQQRILDVEASILQKDAITVAAYDIVPLAGLVGDFEGWKRRMEWFWEMAVYISPPLSQDRLAGKSPCSGAGLINKLRREAQTGYADIADAASELGKVAETAWLRQLSSWVLHGRLSTLGATDFFIQPVEEEGKWFAIHKHLMPDFVRPDIGSAILFIGKSLSQIRDRGTSADDPSLLLGQSGRALLPEHLRLLSTITVPVTPATLSTAVNSIRVSLSQNALQRLLPLSEITQALTILYDFFLLGRAEFAGTLVRLIDDRLEARGRSHPSSKSLLRTGGDDSAKDSLFKDSELSNILEHTFAALATTEAIGDDNDISADAVFERARSVLQFKVDKSKISPHHSVTFNDLILPLPSRLTLAVNPPLDLFLSPTDITTYSRINSFLISIERAHMHLTSLWRLTSMRRDHPCPAGPRISSSQHGRKILIARRQRRKARDARMRKVWATVGKAVFFLSELMLHLEGTVINSAWNELIVAITGHAPGTPVSAGKTADIHSQGSSAQDVVQEEASTSSSPVNMRGQSHSRGLAVRSNSPPASQDPSALALLHRTYLDTLLKALLLSDQDFAKELKQLLLHLENLVAQVKRLQVVQTNLDLETDDGVVDGLNDWGKEESGVELELDRARKKADEGLRACVDALGRLDASGQRLPTQVDNGTTGFGDIAPRDEIKWSWSAPGVDRLLMKLEYGRIDSAGSDEDDVT